MANGNISLYLDIYRNGKREYEFLKLYLIKATTQAEKEQNRQTLATAQAIKAKRQIEIQNGEYGFTRQFRLDTPFLDYFRKMCTAREGTPETRGNWGNWYSCLKHLEEFCTEETTFRDITPEWVESFKAYLATAKCRRQKTSNGYNGEQHLLSSSSKASYFSKLKACLNQAFEERIIPDNPIKGIEGFKVEERERPYLTLEEVRKLAATECDYPILKRAFMFSCLTGLRKSDIQLLTWGEVHQHGEFTRLVFNQKKTGGLEYLDITKQAVPYMGERKAPDVHVFEDFKYGSWTSLELRRWLMSAGILKPDITFHSARHTFAVIMLELGAEIYTVSKLLGHRELATTQIYAKIVDKKKQEAVNLIPEL